MAENTKRRGNGIVFAVCILGFVLLQAVIIIGERVGGNKFTPFNGVVMALQFAICLFMVYKEHKKGIIISMILMGLAMLFILRAMVFLKRLAPLPGFCNLLLYVIALVFIAKQFRIREKEAITDMLTGLYNLRGLDKIIRKKIEDNKPFSVLYIQLENFVTINDNYGHACGDFILKIASKRMTDVVKRYGTVARMSGDRFVCVIDGNKDAEVVANKIIEKNGESIILMMKDAESVCYLKTIVGISTYPDNATECEELVKCADIALYHVSAQRDKRVLFFDAEMKQELNRKIEVEKLIREGLDNGYFSMVYQPQYKIDGKSLRGFESLLRMNAPDGTAISPGEFIPVAEADDLILRIDDYVLKRVMSETKQFITGSNDNLIISINVSAKNIGGFDFVDKIKDIIKETKFPAKNLEIEITEYCFVQSMDTAVENIKKLRELGVQVALDDFGTGYTSLYYLAQMPINLLKIDKSLIDDIEKDEKQRDFVDAAISMGHIMGCEVLSEGVEAEAQVDLLKEQKCDFIQGYVWGKPMAYDDAYKLVMNS